MKSKVLQKLLDKIPPVTKRFYRLSGDAVDQIYTYLDEKGWDQKTLAEKLDKSESEISKLLSGKHNFTLESLAKIEDALQEDIFIVPNHIDKHQRTRTMIQQEIAANSNFLSENLQGLQLASSGIVIKSFKTNDDSVKAAIQYNVYVSERDLSKQHDLELNQNNSESIPL